MNSMTKKLSKKTRHHIISKKLTNYLFLTIAM